MSEVKKRVSGGGVPRVQLAHICIMIRIPYRHALATLCHRNSSMIYESRKEAKKESDKYHKAVTRPNSEEEKARPRAAPPARGRGRGSPAPGRVRLPGMGKSRETPDVRREATHHKSAGRVKLRESSIFSRLRDGV